MRYAIPFALLVCLAALIAISPHLEPQRLRARARHVTRQLRTRDGFREGSKASWAEIRANGLPPFHYGGRRKLDDALIGTMDRLPVRVAGYEVVFNSSRHRYGLVLVGLPHPVEWVEARGERPFSAARVAEHVPDGALKIGVPEFDGAWSVYTRIAETHGAARFSELAQAMLGAPTPFSWRADGTDLLLWKRDGWSDAGQLLASVRSVTGLLGLADPQPNASLR